MAELDRGLGSCLLPPLLYLALLLAGCSTTEKILLDGPKRDKIQAESAIVEVHFSSDSRYIAHLDTNGTVYIWNVLLDKSAGKHSFPEFAAETLAMGGRERFAVAGPQGVRVYSVAGDKVAEFKTGAPVEFMLFDGDSTSLAVAHDTGTVTVHSLNSKQPPRTYAAPPGTRQWRLLPGAGFGVLYLMPDGRIRILSCAARGPDLTVNLQHKGPVSITEDGKLIALVNPQGKVEIRSLPGGELRVTLANLSPAPPALDLSPDGSVLAMAVHGQGVSLWDTGKDELLDTFTSDIWEQAKVSFSRDGNLLAWIEKGLSTVRFWSPVRGVVQWTPRGPVMRSDARGVCPNFAATVRFRLAMTPYARGLDHLRKRDLEKALESFALVRQILPAYPGLDVAEAEARERHKARLLTQRLEAAEGAGDYHVALELLDGFLREYGKFDDYGFPKRADTLRRMLKHFDSAEEHRKAARDIDAVIEFQLAAAIVPELVGHHPEYPEMHQRMLKTLAEGAETAYGSQDFERVIILYEDLTRLRELTPESLLRLGDAHNHLGSTKKAEDVYLAVSEDAPEFVAAQRRIAGMARATFDYQKARNYLGFARQKAPKRVDVATEYAEICELCEDHAAAIETWEEIGEIEPTNPKPYEVIAGIQEKLEFWNKAAAALRTAVTRSDRPRPKLLLKMVDVYLQSKQRTEVLNVYLELIGLADSDPQSLAFLGATPRQTVENRIRKLGFVWRGNEWIPRERFLEEQGWKRSGGDWLRPKEVRLREVIKRFDEAPVAELRALSDERYKAYANGRRITKGMNRREVIRAWGFFRDHNVALGGDGKAVFEQLLFARSRQVYLKNGLVCFWSE
ncbi:MAG: hypothetical protein ACYTGW_13885 [Planctomycetota bacterium]|jgi:tetratricopeptide (TPR) repeat protein